MEVKLNKKDKDALLGHLDKMAYFADKKVSELIEYEADIAVQQMKKEVPQPPPHPDASYPTGHLQRNIHSITIADETTITSQAFGKDWETGMNVDYAPQIEEYGGRNKKGLHYFRNNITEMWNRLLQSVEEGYVQLLSTNKTGARARFGPTYDGRRGGSYTPGKYIPLKK